MQTILYIHGFKSSSQSRKATQLRDWLGRDYPHVAFISPDLPFEPTQALAELRDICRGTDPAALTLVGSSLGGFYAVVLAEEFGCKAVLLNPSIKPFETLEKFLGEQANMYTGEKFVFDRAHITQLRSEWIAEISRPLRYLLIVEMGDELLDHEQTISCLPGASKIVMNGGDHELRSFPDHLQKIVEFAGLNAPTL